MPKEVQSLATWDFTFFSEISKDEFMPLIQQYFKEWTFQKEKTPTTDRIHYQGRGVLHKKKRQSELVKLLNEGELKGMEVSASSLPSLQKEVFYCMKADTRIEGPWTDKDAPPQYIPRQFRGLLDKLFPFQREILDSRNTFCDRGVNFLYDPTGNSGKSTIACLAQLHYKGIDLPPIGDAKELTQVVCDILMAKDERNPQLIFVDLPRGLAQDPKRLSPFMIAVEQIKKGHVCDVRNRYREWWFDSPQVWLFSNYLPDFDMMSADRWRFYTIIDTPFGRQLRLNSKDEMLRMLRS